MNFCCDKAQGGMCVVESEKKEKINRTYLINCLMFTVLFAENGCNGIPFLTCLYESYSQISKSLDLMYVTIFTVNTIHQI